MTKIVIGFPVQPFALGMIVTVAVPVTVVKEGIAVTPVWSVKPMAAPPVISKTTPAGVPDNGMAVVVTPLQ